MDLRLIVFSLGNNFGSNAGLIEVFIGELYGGNPCRNVVLVTAHTLLTCNAPAGVGQNLSITIIVNGIQNGADRFEKFYYRGL
jgi:IPT/TIG domain